MANSLKKKRNSKSPPPDPNKRVKTEHDTDMPVEVDPIRTVRTPTSPFDGSDQTVLQQSDLFEATRRDLIIVPQQTETRPPDQGGGPTLDSLLMHSGSLSDLIKEGGTWPKIADDLREVFLAYQRKLPTEDDETLPEEYVAQLCTAYYSYGNDDAEITMGDDAEFLKETSGSTQVPDVVKFLGDFMKANGQWDYINNQEWFKNGKFVIGIDVNYYPDRSGFYKETPVFHKDTGGNNIFVNLIFDNKKPIEATEWFEDVAPPSTKRAKWQEALLPKTHLDELNRGRETVRAKLKRQKEETKEEKPVSGGTSEGPYTFVSWVDDLAWHATPTDSPRLELTGETALALYDQLDSAASKAKDPEDFWFKFTDKQVNRDILGIEIIGTMAEVEGTHVNDWLKSKGLQPQDVDWAVAQEAWRALYSGELDNGPNQYTEDVALRATMPWRITGETSEANAEDPHLENEDIPSFKEKPKSIKETPIGLSTRRRSNSLEGNREKIKEVRDANKDVPRAFLRTWVRMLNKDSKEAVDGLFGGEVK